MPPPPPGPAPILIPPAPPATSLIPGAPPPPPLFPGATNKYEGKKTEDLNEILKQDEFKSKFNLRSEVYQLCSSRKTETDCNAVKYENEKNTCEYKNKNKECLVHTNNFKEMFEKETESVEKNTVDPEKKKREIEQILTKLQESAIKISKERAEEIWEFGSVPLNDKIENVKNNYKAILNGQYDKLLQPKNLTKEKFADTLLNFSDVVNIITFGNLNDVSKAITVESVRKKLNNPSGEKPQMNTFQRSAFSQLIRVEPDQKVYFPKSKFSNFFDKTFDKEIEYYHYLKSSALKRPDLNNTRLVSAKFTKSTKGAAITEYLMSTTNGTQFDTLKLAVIFEYCDNTCDSAAINYLFIPNGINEDTFINENKIIIGDDETQEEYTIINSSENPASKQIDRVLEYLNENENTEGQDFQDFQNFFSGAFKLTGLTSFHDEVRWDFVKENWPKFVKKLRLNGNKYMGAWEKLAKIENERFFC